MGRFAQIVLVLLICIPRAGAAHSALPSELKGWPWYQSTILGGISQPAVDQGHEFPIPVPGTAKILRGQEWKLARSQGLVLLIPGTGANAQTGLANLTAEDFARLGFDVVIVANPFSPEFQETFSRDGLIGLPQRDVADSHRMLTTAYQQYAARYGKPPRLLLAGVSLGALYAALEARHSQPLHYDQILLFNPPTSLPYGIARLDDMIRISIAESDVLPFNFQVIWAFLQAQHGMSLENIRGIRMFLPEQEKEGLRLIGDTFRQALRAVARGLLKLDAATLNPNIRRRVEENLAVMTFGRLMGYSGTALAERGEVKGSIESLMAQAELVPILTGAAALPQVSVFTNADDFLLRAGDLERLEKILGNRLFVFEAGGHCGNYWTPSFRSLLAKILK